MQMSNRCHDRLKSCMYLPPSNCKLSCWKLSSLVPSLMPFTNAMATSPLTALLTEPFVFSTCNVKFIVLLFLWEKNSKSEWEIAYPHLPTPHRVCIDYHIGGGRKLNRAIASLVSNSGKWWTVDLFASWPCQLSIIVNHKWTLIHFCYVMVFSRGRVYPWAFCYR